MLEIKNLIRMMVIAIVDDETSVRITEEKLEDGGLLYEITAGKDDVGKLIGKGGRIATALRVVARAAGAKHNCKVIINVMKKPLAQE